MKLDKFRLIHSEMIEYYQRSEICIRELYSIACEYEGCEQVVDADWGDIFEVLDQLSLMTVNSKVIALEDMVLPHAEYMLQKRDYWLFECYLDIKIDKETQSITDINAIKNTVEDYGDISTVYELLRIARDKARTKLKAKQKRATAKASKKINND